MKKISPTLIVFAVLSAGLFGTCAGDTLTVGPDSNDYNFTSIQAAIAAAVSGDEIAVAPGTYTEAIDFLGKGVRLYSGAGAGVTTLDGTGYTHVVQCISGEGPGTILEGFTITGGNADGPYWFDKSGGGMFNDGSSPTVIGCVFIGNYAKDNGGGMCNLWNSHPTVAGCTFFGNTAETYGGGMSNNSYSQPTVSDCVFSENSAYFGGGMFNENNLVVTDCLYSGNTASNGGGMFNAGSVTVTGCVFSENTATKGGGMTNSSAGSATVADCVFQDNTVNGNGGGMYNLWCTPTLTRCAFSGNAAYYVVDEDDGGSYGPGDGGYGGGMFNENFQGPDVIGCIFSDNFASYGGGMSNWQDCNSNVTQCIFIGNAAAKAGGGMYNGQSSSPIVTGSTFSGNTAVVFGGGIRNWRSSMTATNCIVWGNSPNAMSSADGAPVVSFCDIQGGWGGAGANNIDADPLFADAAGGNLRPGRGSPCIDAGDNTAVPTGVTVDLDGWGRFYDDPCTSDTGFGTGSVVDMGVYELMPADIDRSEAVDFGDFIMLAVGWLGTGSGGAQDADMNCDGVVNMEDAAILAINWLIEASH